MCGVDFTAQYSTAQQPAVVVVKIVGSTYSSVVAYASMPLFVCVTCMVTSYVVNLCMYIGRYLLTYLPTCILFTV